MLNEERSFTYIGFDMDYYIFIQFSSLVKNLNERGSTYEWVTKDIWRDMAAQ